MDFKELNEALRPHALAFIQGWLSGGKIIGREYRCGSINGGAGNSFGVNLESLQWGDLNAGENMRGGDLISLYAAIFNMTQIQAAKELAEQIGFKSKTTDDLRNIIPKFISQRHGPPSAKYPWVNERGVLLAYTVRYDYIDETTGKKAKTFMQWHFSDTEQKWIPKGLTENRPLYKLNEIANNPDKKILIVEGEKAVEAAQKMVGSKAIVTTWMGGSAAIKKTNWTPLTNRDVTIWPDNDKAGLHAAEEIALLAYPYVTNLKIYDVSKLTELPQKFDAADAEFINLSTKKLFGDLIAVQKILKPLASLPSVDKNEIDVAPLGRVEIVEDSFESGAISIDVSGGVSNFERADKMAMWRALSLQFNQSDTQPNHNTTNVVRILERHPAYAGKFFEDTFKMQRYFDGALYKDDYNLNFLYEMQSTFGLSKVSKTSVLEALDYIFTKNRINKFEQWIKSLEWDGVNRIDRFFIEYFGAHDTNYSSAVSKNFWIGMLRRALMPGTKFDNMVIVEGVQGARKSSAFQAIGGEYFDTIGEDPTNKDFFLKLIGKLIVEVAELDSFRKAEATTLKRILSTSTDNFRAPYARRNEEHPRTCLLVGTTNRKDYLSDTTGNRRFWPIDASKILIDKIKKDREQLFAEAYLRSQTDEPHWEVPQEYLEEIYSKRMSIDRDDSPDSDEWFSDVVEYSKNKYTIKIKDFLVECLNMEPAKITKKESNRVGKILRHIGWAHKSIKIDGIVFKIWNSPRQIEKESDKSVRSVINHATGERKDIYF